MLYGTFLIHVVLEDKELENAPDVVTHAIPLLNLSDAYDGHIETISEHGTGVNSLEPTLYLFPHARASVMMA
jgi:hypothetical protein